MSVDHLHFAGAEMYRWMHWRFVHFVDKCLPNPREFIAWTKDSPAGFEYIRQMSNVEAITTYLAFLEVLPVYLTHVHKVDTLQAHLLAYNVNDSEKYYTSLAPENWRNTFDALGYDTFEGLRKEQLTEFEESAKAIHEHLMECGEFYLSLKGLLNSFKHGMRVLPLHVGPSPEVPTYNAIGYFPDRKDDNAIALITWSNEQTHVLSESFSILFTIVDDLFTMFGQAWIAKDKEGPHPVQFGLHLFRKDQIPTLPRFVDGSEMLSVDTAE